MGILPWQLKINIPLISMASMLTQAFYTFRLSMIGRPGLRQLYPVLLAAGSLMAWGFGTYSAVRVSDKTIITDFKLIIPKVYGWFCGTLVVDVLIMIGTGYCPIWEMARISCKNALHSPLTGIARRAVQTHLYGLVWQLLALVSFYPFHSCGGETHNFGLGFLVASQPPIAASNAHWLLMQALVLGRMDVQWHSLFGASLIKASHNSFLMF
ncbi:hypothetical protein JCM11641_004283 [Rhodosporidiobolus odoratus]